MTCRAGSSRSSRQSTTSWPPSADRPALRPRRHPRHDGPVGAMSLLVLSAADVHTLLDHAECAAAMRSALIALQTGRAQQPLRTVVRPEGAAGLVALMPSYLDGEQSGAYGLKAICITAANPAAGLDTHQGVVLLSSGRTGEPLALLN